MKQSLLWWLIAACLIPAAPPPARAQESVENVRIELRVVSARVGSAVIDRGSADGLTRGDRITFRTREGKAYFGTLRRIEERGAQVDLDDPNFVPPAGMRGEALVPAARLKVALPPPPAASEAAPQTPPTAPEHPPWPAREDEWTQDQALLARVQPLRPSQRPSSIRGRVYSIVDIIHSTEDDRSDGFYRLGGEATIENSRGSGERIQFDGELNYRQTDVPDNGDDTGTYLRVDRASYAVGGNRFQPNRFEFGRFMHDNLPEFGLVDGIEWSKRRANGDRYGLSAGFMPEPDPALQSIQDFEVSASYRWIYDDSEQLSAAGGFQKTLHNSEADRDLFVGKFQYLPRNGWSFTSTGWFDYYRASDTAKGQSIEVTQAYVNTGKSWENGNSLSMVYSHLAYPELKRDEFLPVTTAQLADDHNDRLALQARVRVSDPMRLHASTGAWVDQDDSGSDLDFGVEVDDLVSERSLIDVSGFATEGKFVSVLGARAMFSRQTNFGQWGAEYELSNNRINGFNDNNDDLPQHRLRLFTDFFLDSGWSLSGHLETIVWDHENSVALGFYLQKSF